MKRIQFDPTILLQRFKKPLIWSAAIFAVLMIFAFFGLPPLIKSLLIKRLSATLHRDVSIQTVTLNPFTLSLTVRGVLVKDRGTPDTFASFDELFVNLEGLSALRSALIVKEIRVSQPFIRIIRHRDNTYNFSDLFERGESQKSDAVAPLKFSLNNIQVINGGIDLWDESKQKRHTVRDANIALPFISNFPHHIETYVQPTFSATINDTRYSLEGKTKPFAASRETTFDITINNFDIAYYFPYVPLETDFTIPSGHMDARAQVSFVQHADGKRALTLKGDLAITQISLNDAQNRAFLKLPLLNISLTSAEPFSRLFHFSSVSLQSPELHIRRDRAGTFNLASLFPGKQKVEKGPEVESDVAPLSVDVDEIHMTGGKISFSDLSRTSAPEMVPGSDDGEKKDSEDRKPGGQATVQAEDIGLRVESLSTREGQKGTVSVSFSLNQKGRVGAKGSIALKPLSAQLALDAKDIDIRPVQPYLSDQVKINITSGLASTTGNLSFTEQKGIGPQITYSGNVFLSRFSSIDMAHAEDFLTWKSLYLADLKVGYNPTFLLINKVALTDFYARLILHADGSLNLQRIIVAKPQTPGQSPATSSRKTDAPAGTQEKTVKDIRIQQVTLQGGRINFTDRSLKPSYSANLVEMGGRISGLSSKATTLADVEIRGKLDQYAPLEIIGKINPLQDDLFVDLKVKFRDMDLSPVTPYSGKYIGYTIQKGKLFFEVSYRIAKRKLDSENKLFLDQLTLGDSVESPHATRLPVKLAIALLKDRKGEIHLDLPVTGSLDDPQFSVWRVIIQILLNLFAKAATSPFALLGAAFGGGEELGYLEFDYGSAAIAEPELKKLDTLAKALYERPSLKLEIEGHVEVERDREGLRRFLFNRKLTVQKSNERSKQGLPATPVDELKVEPQEYEKYLTMAYKAEKFPKPRNVLGFAKSLPVPEMEKLMLTNIVITDSALRSLATQRAMNVKDIILKSGKIQPERAFIIEPKSLSPETRDKVKDSRVDVRIK